MNYAIEIRNLTKNYGKYRGVKNIFLTVEKGDIFGFLGPNGAGKSTTIRSMLGMLPIREEGEIKLLTMNIKNEQTEILKKVGYMPSESMFYPSMRVKDVIRFAADVRKLDCKKEANRICDMLNVDTNKKIHELSLGNRKKVSIVCAMQHKPELLILDEPTSGLDPLMQEAFFSLILDYNKQGTTCFLSSHVLSEIKQYCRNAAIIKEGQIIKTDSVENLTKSNLRKVKLRANGEQKEFTYTGNMKDFIHKLDKMDVEDLLMEETSLDELFMHYYEKEEK